MEKKYDYLVIGGGISGKDIAKLLAESGNTVTLTDEQVFSQQEISNLGYPNITFKSIDQCALIINTFAAIILSPGVPPSNSLVTLARNKTRPIFSEIEFSLSLLKPTLITVGITGTNGKSTVCMMIEHILNKTGYIAKSAGNIGDTVSKLILQDKIPEILVLELSSYQLEQSTTLHLNVAIFTTFSPDHLERHKSLENYFDEKWKITRFLKPGGHFITTQKILKQAQIYGLTLPTSCSIHILNELLDCPKSDNPLFHYNEWVFDSQSNCAINGNTGASMDLNNSQQSTYHNKTNAILSALATDCIFPRNKTDYIATLSSFTHLPFRCEIIMNARDTYEIINDSKSTNVESTLSALAGRSHPVILLMGGRPKGESYKPILKQKSSIVALLAFGEAAHLIESELGPYLNVTNFNSLSSCLDHLMDVFVKSPAPILFSPACASFDEFKNFEARGKFFNTRIYQLFT